MPDKGMIFPEPIKKTKVSQNFKAEEGEMRPKEITNEQEVVRDDDGNIFWGWTVVKASPIPEDEHHKYPDPSNPGTFYKHKMDMKNLHKFDKLCFMDAAEKLGMFEKQSINIGSEGDYPSKGVSEK